MPRQPVKRDEYVEFIELLILENTVEEVLGTYIEQLDRWIGGNWSAQKIINESIVRGFSAGATVPTVNEAKKVVRQQLLDNPDYLQAMTA